MKVWQKSFERCLEIHRMKAKFPNVKGVDKVLRKQTLESLTPGVLGPSSPTKLEKNLNHKLAILYCFENHEFNFRSIIFVYQPPPIHRFLLNYSLFGVQVEITF